MTVHCDYWSLMFTDLSDRNKYITAIRSAEELKIEIEKSVKTGLFRGVKQNLKKGNVQLPERKAQFKGLKSVVALISYSLAVSGRTLPIQIPLNPCSVAAQRVVPPGETSPRD